MLPKFTDTPLFFFCPCSKCTTFTFGDLCKFMVPVGWIVISILSALSYALIPDEPQWASVCAVALGAISGIGLVFAIYGFHRRASSFAIEENYNCEDNDDMSFEGKQILMTVRRKMRKQSLRTHAVLSTLLAMSSIAAAVFFGFFASECDESSGSDVAWSGMGFLVSTLWMGVTHLGYRDLRNVLKLTDSTAKEDLVMEEENTFKTVEVNPDSPAEDEDEESSKESKVTEEFKV